MAGRAAVLTGRDSDRGVFDRLVEAVRAGESRALVVHGEPGVGKTALLDYLAAAALGCRIERATGVESEMELAFAGLHQLCAPMLDRLETVPVPQREALRERGGQPTIKGAVEVGVPIRKLRGRDGNDPSVDIAKDADQRF